MSRTRPQKCKRHCEICRIAVTGRNKTTKQKHEVLCHPCSAKVNRMTYRVRKAFFFEKRKVLLLFKGDKAAVVGYITPETEAVVDKLMGDVADAKTRSWCG